MWTGFFQLCPFKKVQANEGFVIGEDGLGEGLDIGDSSSIFRQRAMAEKSEAGGKLIAS